MSERLKRRKKPGDGDKEATKAPEPLQPKFYDNEPVAPVAAPVDVPVVETPVVQSRRPSRPEPEVAAESASAPAPASSAVESKPRPARRRRSRGGRGGSRPRTVAAPGTAAEPATAEGSVAQASVA